ncbi:unnamed protein product [Mytilus edulis]|uniref:Uncharacterized protein n=1 Tax=Mytilus edulis TaxID=6550 RepID=A0A8S3RD77_MYTED|nr:unnamed protein product [Mytilus edulis]
MATRQSSSSQRRFEKKCGCLNHDFFSNDQASLIQAQSVSRRSSYKALLSRGLITTKIKYICNGCLQHAQEHFVHSMTLESSFSDHDTSLNISHSDHDTSLISTNNGNDISVLGYSDNMESSINTDYVQPAESIPTACITFDQIIAFLSSLSDWNVLEKSAQDSVAKISEILGGLISQAIYKEGRCMQEKQEYKNIDIEKNNWMNERNPALIGFVYGATGFRSDNLNDRKINAVVHGVEQIYYARNIKLVTPFAFQRNLVSYSLTNSKLCTSLNGCWESSGSYSTVHSYICSPCDPINCPDGYVHCAIDNNQKVGKSSGRISVNSKVPVDVCTSVSNFQIDSENSIQNKTDLMPSEWQLENRTDVLNRVGVYENRYIDIFRCYRNRLIFETLNEIKSDQLKSVDGKVYDKIDILSRQAEMQLSNMVCINCSFVFPGTIDVCPKCKHDHKYNLLGYDP